MADGFVGLFVVPDEGAQLAVVNSNGSWAVTEVVDSPLQAKKSKAKISATGVTFTSGMASSVSIEYRRSAVPAINIVFFGGTGGTTNIVDGDTITISDGTTPRVYTFKNTLTAINQVKISTASVKSTVINFVKTINLTGTEGTHYYAGQTINDLVAATVDHVNVTLRAKAGGAGGNAYTLATNASARIAFDNATFTGGDAADPTWKNGGSFPLLQTSGAAGWSGATNNSADFIIEGLQCSSAGILYDFQMKMFNSDLQQAVNGSNVAQTHSVSNVLFNGIDDLSEWVEVYDLRITNASNPEGNLTTPETLPPGGIMRAEWSDMTKYTRLKDQPTASGGTTDVNELNLSQLSTYVLFLFISATGSAPQHNYPSASDTGGTWYLVSKTKNTFAEIQCPKNKKVALWVGFGTQNTAVNSSNTIDLPQLSLSQY